MLTELELKIKSAAQKYYTDGSSPYSDEEFDSLVEHLKAEQPDSILFKVGWGYDVSEDTTPGMKREHSYTTIGSLDKCHDLKELGKELIGLKLDISTKLDGLSVVLYYENSLLKYALTRGDSYLGIDITDKILKINPIFSKTQISFTGAVRGEIIMSFNHFEEFKKVHPDAKNPRNSTAGLVNGKDTFDDLIFLDVILYTLVHDEDRIFKTVGDTRKHLVDLFGTPEIVVPYFDYLIPYTCSNSQFVTAMDEFKIPLYNEYPADGLVLSKQSVVCNNGTYGYEAKAFKFPAESKMTTVIDVEWNMSKTKVAVPRLLLEPVQLSGTTVQACAGYNAQYIVDNFIGPGTVVEICKSGEIIPNVVQVYKHTTASCPTHCPDCGCSLFWEGVNLVCRNPQCSSGIEQDLLTWLQNLVPLDNLGDTLKLKFINQLIDSGRLEDNTIESVMKCKLHLSEDTSSVQFNNFAKMWNNLHYENFKFDLVKSLIACNIPRIGDLTAIKFANYPKLIQELLDCTFLDETDDLFIGLKNKIGVANGLTVLKYFDKLHRLNLIRNRIIWKKDTSANFKGKVAITGKLSVKRADFEKELRKYGWEPGELTKDCKFLITENPDGSSSKNQKANKLGIPKITEYSFRLKYFN